VLAARGATPFRESRLFGLYYGMLFRSGSKLLAVIASGVLMTGCRVPSSDDNRSADSTSDKPATVVAPTKVRAMHSTPIGGTTPNSVEAHAHYAQAVVQELNGETELALESFLSAARNDPDNEQLILEVSRRLLQAKQEEKARDLLVQATSRPNATGPMFARLGFIYFQLGKPDLAVASNKKAIAKEPQSFVGYQNLFLISIQSQKPNDALAVLDDAAKVPRTSAEFLIGLGELYGNYGLQVRAQRDMANARGAAVLDRAAKSQSLDPQLRLRLANAFNMVGKEEEAAKIYAAMLKDLPDVPFTQDVRARLADIYLREHDQEHAEQQLERIIEEDPTDSQAHYLLGRIATDKTNFVKAADSFSKVILLQPSFEPAYYELAYAQLMEGKYDDSIVTLSDARGKFRQNFFLEFLTGTAYSHQKDYTNAIKSYTTAEVVARATEPARLTDSFYFQFGAACERAGDYTQAEKLFEKCLSLSPNLAEAQNYLGFMWADRGENLSRARELIEKAVKAEPQNAAYLDSMGWVLFKLNNFNEALKYMEDAIKNSEEEDPTIYDHLGDIYAALKQTDKAREAWQKSLSLEPNDTVRRKLEPPADGRTAR
jgi:tetratricopeptide (TPR) repeat protein